MNLNLASLSNNDLHVRYMNLANKKNLDEEQKDLLQDMKEILYERGYRF